MRVSDFHFDLPEDLIAQTPPPERGASRMLVLDRGTGNLADRHFRDLPGLLRPGDLLVLNDTRVLPARLFATKATVPGSRPSGPHSPTRIEVLLTHPHPPPAGTAPDQQNVWNALVRPGKKVRIGDHLVFAGDIAPDTPLLRAEVLASGSFGERTLRFAPEPNFLDRIEQLGHMPLPPYIKRPRNTPDLPADRERYQTVYAQAAHGSSAAARSAAAPTAGLHFTPEILAALSAHGVEITTLTLHVGIGTFQPVRVDTTEEIRLHAERYTLSPETAAAINRARAESRRIIAVGTTTTRTLEHCARLAAAQGSPAPAPGAPSLAPGDPALMPGSGETSLFLSPGDPFLLVSGLLTNFHLPESTLLMLVSAFAGRDAVLHAYAHAVHERYRFFSYGDCMLLL